MKIDNIKRFVDTQLEKLGLYDKIKHFIDDVDDNDEDMIMDRLKEAGMIDEILECFKQADSNSNTRKNQIESTKKCLYFKMLNGSGFVDYIQSNDAEASFFIFDILFLGQRFQSKKIQCSPDFSIDEAFILDFNPMKLDIEIDFERLKRLSCPIHIVLIKQQGEEKTLVGTKLIEWRWTLCYGSWKIEAEMYSPSSLNKLNVGSIELQLTLLPYVQKTQLLTQRTVTEHLNSEKKYETECAQDYIKYCNDWWEDYKCIRNSHNIRLIKLFVPTEDRENYVYKPANSLIEPISVGRAINTPYEASRFVSLIPFERRENPGGEKNELWQSSHTFLAVGKGDVEDHSILLCNLLLGFGLDAYVAVGLSVNGPHVWVISRSKLENKKYSTTFWESLTGQRVLGEDPKVFRFYKKVHCLFNENRFYANIQIDDTVFNTIYNLEDEFLWKNIPNDKLTALPKYSFTPTLDAIKIDKYQMEMDIEKEMKSKIMKFRKNNLDLKTAWDGKLGYLVSPCLVNYELERVSNLTFGNDEFKQSVKNYVPEGYTFKGFPIQTIEPDSDKIFDSIISNQVGHDILHTRGDNCAFAVRCKIFPYPQNINSIWVMISVKFRQIK